MEYIDTTGGHWVLTVERDGTVSYRHENYDGPEDKRCGWAETKRIAICQIEDLI